MKFGRSFHRINNDDVSGNESEVWLFERMAQRKRKLRDLFLARHGDADSIEEASSINWFDAIG